MGKCKPLYALVGLGLPEDTTVDYVDKLYTGMNKIGCYFGLKIVGGDTVLSTKGVVISVTLIGEAMQRHLLTRAGAQLGDKIYVTGTLGDSAGGLYLLQKGIRQGRGYIAYLLSRHRLPEPRLSLAARLTATRQVTSMIDSSDGLSVSLRLIAEASGVGARIDIEKVPVSRALGQLAKKFKDADPLDFSITGGEDYELVFTAPPSADEKLSRISGVTAIGTITAGRHVDYYLNGTPKKITTSGYRHF
jgi:thiamine-monophosphate kinase